MLIVTGVLAAALAAGCASGGSSEKLGPTVNAPTVNQAPERTTATVSPTPAMADTTTAPATTSTPRTDSRHILPNALATRAPLDTRYEYRFYYYLPVNARGQNELGLLLKQLAPDGWELHQVQVAPVGHCSALFRRDKQVPIRVSPVNRMTSPASPATGTGSASPSGNATGTPSSLPPAPAR